MRQLQAFFRSCRRLWITLMAPDRSCCKGSPSEAKESNKCSRLGALKSEASSYSGGHCAFLMCSKRESSTRSKYLFKSLSMSLWVPREFSVELILPINHCVQRPRCHLFFVNSSGQSQNVMFFQCEARREVLGRYSMMRLRFTVISSYEYTSGDIERKLGSLPARVSIIGGKPKQPPMPFHDVSQAIFFVIYR